MTTKTYTLNQLRALAIAHEQQLCKAFIADAPVDQIKQLAATSDMWRVRLMVAEEECEQFGKVEWTYEVQDTPTTVQYAWVALGVVVAVCSIPFIVEAIVWVASVWGL